jgi:trigger factor
MQSQIKQISPVLYDITVEIPWEEVEKELESAFRKLQQNARIRGFRAGKAPMNVVRQLMGKSVKDEVRNTLMHEGLTKAVTEHELELITIQEMEKGTDIADGKPLTFNAKFEVRPKIESIDMSALEIEKVVDPVTDDIVNKEIEQLRERHADTVTPDPVRPSRKGDILTVDYTISVTGEEKEDLRANDRQFELGVGRLLPQLDEGLLDLKPEDKKTIQVDFPADFSRKDLQGVKADFNVVVKEIREKKLPQLDDEFAKDLEFESLEQMKSSIRKQLEDAAQQRADNQVKQKLIDLLIEKNPVPVPPSLLARQERALLETYLQFQQYAGMERSMSEEVGNEIRQSAERKVRGALLFSEIARDQKLEITEENMEKRLAEIAEKSGKHLAKIKADYTEKMIENLHAEMMEEKLVEYLLSKATIKDAAPATPKPVEESGQ